MRRSESRDRSRAPDAKRSLDLGFFVLIVEDELLDARAIARSIGSTVPVRTVCTRSEGLAQAREPLLLAAFCDLALPDGDGTDVLEALRKRSGRPVPAAAITATRGRANEVQLLGAEYIEKPWRSENVDLFLERAGVRRWSRLRDLLACSPEIRRLPDQPARALLLAAQSRSSSRDEMAAILGVDLRTLDDHTQRAVDWWLHYYVGCPPAPLRPRMLRLVERRRFLDVVAMLEADALALARVSPTSG